MNILLWLVGYSVIIKGLAYETLYGVVGGKVLFRCPSDKDKIITFLYFQGGTDFSVYINGWYDNKSTNSSRKYTTSVNRTERTVSMWNLTSEEEGLYKCIIQYNQDHGRTQETIIFLNVSEITTPPPTPTPEGEQSNCQPAPVASLVLLFIVLFVLYVMNEIIQL